METSSKVYLTNNEMDLYDPNFRYQINKLQYRKATKKGRVTTIIDNLDEFCLGLDVPSNVLLSVIGRELSTRTSTGHVHSLQGEFDAKTINVVVYTFIQSFVLCVNCGNPEVILRAKKATNKIKQTCKACGSNQYLMCPNVDHVARLLIASAAAAAR
jgi:translation initiation factor 2 beta subunit (eIF-2beta)/eIF-5